MRRLVAEHRAVLGPAAVRDGTPRPIDVRRATYSYLELHDWRARAQELVWSFSDVVALDLDEFRNRITILLNTGIDEAAIRSRFDVVGVPDGMLSFQVTGPAVPGNHLTVDSTIRPLRGGTQINTSAFGCTYGFNAKLGSSNVLLTNSHCTPTLFGFDGTPVYQTGFPAIGSEWLTRPQSASCIRRGSTRVGTATRRSSCTLRRTSTSVGS